MTANTAPKPVQRAICAGCGEIVPRHHLLRGNLCITCINVSLKGAQTEMQRQFRTYDPDGQSARRADHRDRSGR